MGVLHYPYPIAVVWAYQRFIRVLVSSTNAWRHFATLTLIAGLFPALADALKIATSVDEISASAATFKALQDRFRRVATITILSDVDAAEATLAELMDRMDVARSSSITPPERYFTAAQAKIKSGHYDFTVDLPATH